VVVAVGGGTLTDVAGFAAATYLRGVALANIPTTLLAMVDASLGGKTSIDHGGRKNVVGAFHEPVLTVADTTLLGPLPIRLIREGMAEVVKAAVIASPLLFELLEQDARRVLTDPALLAWVVEQAVRIKAAYVSADPRDRHLRHSLNLGHTFAHAIESATAYATTHGEAVAVGLVAAARLGAALGVTDPALSTRLGALLTRLGLRVTVPEGVGPKELLQAMSADKKRRSGHAVFVIPALGGVELVEDPPAAAILDALRPEVAA
jgi:3-dehydroquinate synthetase